MPVVLLPDRASQLGGTMSPEASDFDTELFFIAPIGEEGSPERKRSNNVFVGVVEEVAAKLGMRAVRGDQISEPGQITTQVVRHLVYARAAVADLTGRNPNVFYELAVRHAARLPTVLIAESGEQLPFDLAQMRTIFFDHQDLISSRDCRAQIERQLNDAFNGAVDSPIATAVNMHNLQSGSLVEQGIAELSTMVESLSQNLSTMHGQLTGQLTTGQRDQAEMLRTVDALLRAAGVRDRAQAELDEVEAHLARLDARGPAGSEWARRRKQEIDDEFDGLMKKLLVQEGSILIPEPAPDQIADPSHLLFFSAFGPVGPIIEQSRIAIDGTIAGKIFQSGTVEISPSPYSDQDFSSSVDRKAGHETKNMLTIPLDYQGRRVGVAQFLNRSEDLPFKESDRRLAIEQSHSLTRRLAEFTEDLHNLESVGLYSSMELTEATILFCDLSASSLLFELLDPRVALRSINEYLQRQSQVVLSHGGTIDKYLGDGAMFRFSAPTPAGSEGHPLLAIRAARKMQQDFDVLKKSWDDELGDVEQVFSRLSLAMGQAYTQVVGHRSKPQLTVMGPTVNRASLLHERAPRDRNIIIVDDNVRQCIPADIATRPIPLPAGRPKVGQADVVAFEIFG
jgi:class 3 adenylate cyclase